MTAKLKNTNKLQGFFLAHGEKLGIALALGLSGYFMYASTGQQGIEKDAGDLNQAVNSAQQAVLASTWDQVKEADPTLPTADSFQLAINEPLKPGDFEIVGFDRSVVPPVVLRRDPKLLPAVELEGHGFTTLIGFFSNSKARERFLQEAAEEARREQEREEAQRRDNEEGGQGGGFGPGRGRGGDAFGAENDPNRRPAVASAGRQGFQVSEQHDIRIQPLAAVTAKVPVEDQVKIYEEVFKNALGYDASRDMPRYLGYFVERAEVRPGRPLQFKPHTVRNGTGGSGLKVVSERSIPQAMADWAGEMPDPTAPAYMHPALTFPLPARVGREWDDTVVHSDVMTAAEAEELAAKQDAEAEATTPEATEDAPLFGGADSLTGEGGARRPGGAMRRPGGAMRRPGGMPGGGMRPGMAGGPGGMRRGGGMAARGEGGMPAGGMRRGGRGSSGGEVSYDAPELMIRFIDFNVAPGRQYAYRFKLVLVDVNGKGQVSGGNLEKEVKQRVDKTRATPVPFITTEWSEPSPPISIPLAGSVRIAEVQPPRSGEPTATLLVQSFDRDESGDAIEGEIERSKVRLGTVLNFVEERVWIQQPGENFELRIPEFRFRTGVTLLDADGGDKITKQMNAPGEVLVMDPTGRLSVRRELDDLADVERFRLRGKEGAGAGAGFRGPGGGYGGEGGFGF